MKPILLTGLCLSTLLSVHNGLPVLHDTPDQLHVTFNQTPPLNFTDTTPTLTDTTSKTFEKVEIEASYRGGEQAWLKYIGANLNPEVPVKKKAPAGTYTVRVQFIVLKDGTIGDIEAQTKWGYGMEQEVIRVISASPRWKPATQGGKTVNAYRIQPVTFEVVDARKKKRKSDD